MRIFGWDEDSPLMAAIGLLSVVGFGYFFLAEDVHSDRQQDQLLTLLTLGVWCMVQAVVPVLRPQKGSLRGFLVMLGQLGVVFVVLGVVFIQFGIMGLAPT